MAGGHERKECLSLSDSSGPCPGNNKPDFPSSKHSVYALKFDRLAPPPVLILETVQEVELNGEV